jgi:peptidoglycan/xylan/chitin deacetylase (PgdA/CDA1 family)
MAAVRRAQSGGRRILITGYHRVVEDFPTEAQRSIPGTLISVGTLKRHIEEARAAGFEVVSLDDALDVMSGRRRAKSDLFVITFDDGYEELPSIAGPVLERLSAHATIYLPSGFVGTDRRFNHDRLFHLSQLLLTRGGAPLYDALPATAPALFEPVRQGTKTLSASLDDFIGEHSAVQLESLIEGLERYLGPNEQLSPPQGGVMTWDDARKMANAGFTFGAHTVNHTVLTLVDDETVEREISESKATLQRELGCPVHHFAYCNGWYSERVISALVRHGFRSAVTTEDYLNVIGGDPFALKRKVLWENFSVGFDGDYSGPLTGCHFDDIFGLLRVSSPVAGRREDLLVSDGQQRNRATASSTLFDATGGPLNVGGGHL